MKKLLNKIVICVLVVALFSVCLSACSSKKAMSGIWYFDEEATGDCNVSAPFYAIEFFSDGTYDSSHPNYYGEYSIDGDRIKFDGVLVSPRIYTFKVKGKTLSLGDIWFYKKAQ